MTTKRHPIDRPEDIKKWRAKAEEIRAVVEGMTDPQARKNLLLVAETYDRLAESSEARLNQQEQASRPKSG